jgi:hypothetical protein
MPLRKLKRVAKIEARRLRMERGELSFRSWVRRWALALMNGA